jgi:DHA2 family multidrug resistance protein
MSEAAATETVRHRGLITVLVIFSTTIQALDSTIANLTLPYMQGSLNATIDQVAWVLTSYIIATAIMTAPMGWLANRFGRKQLLILCLVGFAILVTPKRPTVSKKCARGGTAVPALSG